MAFGKREHNPYMRCTAQEIERLHNSLTESLRVTPRGKMLSTRRSLIIEKLRLLEEAERHRNIVRAREARLASIARLAKNVVPWERLNVTIGS